MRTLIVPAPAKLNLFLHVTGRRADGYHDIESLFVLLDYGDTISLKCRDDGAITRRGDLPEVPPDADLALRAAHALRHATDCRQGVEVTIDKRIPVGGGLGGGSSDAASVLLALNRLWRLHCSRDALLRIGATLGADVAFFLYGQSAVARGIGDRLTPVSLPPRWISVIVPPVNVPTAAIFAAPELTRNTRSAKMNVFSEAYGRNDLQQAAIARYPCIAVALAGLAPHSSSARMSGSGGCVFACFGSEAEAIAACTAGRQALPAARGFVARTLASHPLAAFA